MYDFKKIKTAIEKLIYLKDDMPKSLRYLFASTEYATYSIASAFIIYSIIVSLINLFNYIKSKDHNIYFLYKDRLVTGQLLNIALTLILGGLILRLLHITNLKTLLLIVITISLKELIISNIDKESSLVSSKISQYVNNNS